MLEDNYTELFEIEKEKSIREIIDKYLPYKFYFILATIIAIACAFMYLKLATPTYKAVASIIIKDEESTSSSEMSIYSDLGIFSSMGTNSIANELGLLRSKRLMQNTVSALNLQVQYFYLDQLKRREIYNATPFFLEIWSVEESMLNEIKQNEEYLFEVVDAGNNQIKLTNYATDITDIVELDSLIKTEYLNFKIKRNENFEVSKNENTSSSVFINIDPLESIAKMYRSMLQIDLIDENATLIELGIVNPSKQKAKDILNQLVLEYNKEAIEDKNLIAKNTASFIDDRLKIINKELDSVEVGKEQFKEVNRLTNIETESTIVLENASEYTTKRQEVETQLGLVNAMIRYLEKGEDGLLPANLGIQDVNINRMINEFNSLVLERDRILRGATLTNPIVVKLTNQIQQLKQNVKQSLDRKRSNLSISRRNLQKQLGIIGSQISEVPAQERLFRSIERQQNVKEALYLFLLQKREENSLSLAATAPKAKIVDKAYAIDTPISPNPKLILLVSLLAGLLIPFLIFNILLILNNKIESKDDIEKITNKIPVIGQIPHLDKSDSHLIKENDRSILAETLRILISNLYYVKGNEVYKDQSYCIFVTSSIKGEGKTFTAANIAMAMAISGKKTILLGADLRNPQLHKYEKGAKKHKGISNYLADNNEVLSELIRESSLHSNLSILNSGPVPPNPAELLGGSKTAELFKELKKEYEYIIVDTAPSMILVDTFSISKYADLTLYLTRSGFTEKKFIKLPVEAKKMGKLPNVSFVLNDVKLKNFGYGSQYGYEYGNEASEESFLKKIKRLF